MPSEFWIPGDGVNRQVESQLLFSLHLERLGVNQLSDPSVVSFLVDLDVDLLNLVVLDVDEEAQTSLEEVQLFGLLGQSVLW